MGRRQPPRSATAMNLDHVMKGDWPEAVKMRAYVLARQAPPGKPACLVCGKASGPRTSMLWINADVLRVGHERTAGDLQSYWLCGQHRAVGEDQETIDRLIVRRAATRRGERT